MRPAPGAVGVMGGNLEEAGAHPQVRERPALVHEMAGADDGDAEEQDSEPRVEQELDLLVGEKTTHRVSNAGIGTRDAAEYH